MPHAWSIIWPGVNLLSSLSTMLPMLARCASISRSIVRGFFPIRSPIRFS